MSRHSPRVTVVNRTDSILTGTWNGIQYDIPPGEHYFPEDVAKAIRKQNIVMGSEDPRTGKVIYKVGIVEHKDPTAKLTDPDVAEAEAAFNKWGERWNRDKLTGAKPSEVVAGDNGIYSARDVAAKLPFQNSNFVKP